MNCVHGTLCVADRLSVMEKLARIGAVTPTDGHTYIFNKDALYSHAELVSKLCRHLALFSEDHDVGVVVAPSADASSLALSTALHLFGLTDKEVFAAYADAVPDGSFAIRPSFVRLIAGRRILVVDDFITSSAPIINLIDAIRRGCGGTVVGLSAIMTSGIAVTQVISDVVEPRVLLPVDGEALVGI